MPDDMPGLFPSYENNNNPLESFFEELNASDMWNNNDDGIDKLDDGLWSDNAVQPHYEFPSRSRLDNNSKRYKPLRHRADDFKNYFNF